MKDIYNAYVKKLKEETKFDKNKNQTVLVNPWAKTKPQEFWDECWSKIERSGLQFDGNHITINQNGVSYDYVAYKNKMLLAYPESKIDEGIVYKGDSFAFEKTNGAVDYKHILANPFNHKDDDIVGGYCVIKNKRGEFITTLSKEEINKARSVAKTDTIWKQWFAEMCRKTVIKKAVKFHFDDIYSEMSATEQIVKYIAENYKDPKLNLTSAAQHFGFSSSYLSRKFKQDTGSGFVEYLTELRMQKAMQLAKAGVKMFIAASEVGIPDPNYFGRCFKKYTGVGYSEYCKQN